MRWTALIVVFLSLLISRAANADDVSAAQALYEQARIAYDGGDYATAHTLFEQSQRLDAATGTLLNLALCDEKLGRLLEASRQAADVLEQLDEGDRRAPVAAKLHADLERRIPQLTIVVDGAATISLDGRPLTAVELGRPVRVRPGRHALLVTAKGRRDERKTFTVAEGARVTIHLARGEPLPAPTPTTSPVPLPARGTAPSESPSTPWLSIVGWSFVGFGAASLTVTAVMAGLVVDRDSTVDAHCDAQRICDDIAFAAADEGKTFSTVGTVTAVMGLVGVIGGLGMLIPTWIPDGSVSVAPTPGGAMLALTLIR